jgi:phosphoribosyl 1,2-cyclic phosphodiesterase
MRGHDTGSETTFSVTFHGVRGSTPCHGDDIMRYGGNTSCVSVLTPSSQPILFDLGTGLRYFGKECLTRDTKFVGTCLLTHSHFDHTQGLPFFAPLLNDETVLTVRGPVQDDGMSLQAVFDKLVSPPLFPVGLSHIPGTISFVDTSNSDFAPFLTWEQRSVFALNSMANQLPTCLTISNPPMAHMALAMEHVNWWKAQTFSYTIRNSRHKSSQ